MCEKQLNAGLPKWQHVWVEHNGITKPYWDFPGMILAENCKAVSSKHWLSLLCAGTTRSGYLEQRNSSPCAKCCRSKTESSEYLRQIIVYVKWWQKKHGWFPSLGLGIDHRRRSASDPAEWDAPQTPGDWPRWVKNLVIRLGRNGCE